MTSMKMHGVNSSAGLSPLAGEVYFTKDNKVIFGDIAGVAYEFEGYDATDENGIKIADVPQGVVSILPDNYSDNQYYKMDGRKLSAMADPYLFDKYAKEISYDNYRTPMTVTPSSLLLPLTAKFDNGDYMIGCGHNGAYVSACYRYVVSQNRWVTIASHLYSGWVQAFTYNGEIYTYGAFNGTTYYNALCKYNEDINTWELVSNFGTARTIVTLKVVGDILYVIGGGNASGKTSEVNIYNMAKGTLVKTIPNDAGGFPETYSNEPPILFGRYIIIPPSHWYSFSTTGVSTYGDYTYRIFDIQTESYIVNSSITAGHQLKPAVDTLNYIDQRGYVGMPCIFDIFENGNAIWGAAYSQYANTTYYSILFHPVSFFRRNEDSTCSVFNMESTSGIYDTSYGNKYLYETIPCPQGRGLKLADGTYLAIGGRMVNSTYNGLVYSNAVSKFSLDMIADKDGNVISEFGGFASVKDSTLFPRIDYTKTNAYLSGVRPSLSGKDFYYSKNANRFFELSRYRNASMLASKTLSFVDKKTNTTYFDGTNTTLASSVFTENLTEYNFFFEVGDDLHYVDFFHNTINSANYINPSITLKKYGGVLKSTLDATKISSYVNSNTTYYNFQYAFEELNLTKNQTMVDLHEITGALNSTIEYAKINSVQYVVMRDKLLGTYSSSGAANHELNVYILTYDATNKTLNAELKESITFSTYQSTFNATMTYDGSSVFLIYKDEDVSNKNLVITQVDINNGVINTYSKKLGTDLSSDNFGSYNNIENYVAWSKNGVCYVYPKNIPQLAILKIDTNNQKMELIDNVVLPYDLKSGGLYYRFNTDTRAFLFEYSDKNYFCYDYRSYCMEDIFEKNTKRSYLPVKSSSIEGFAYFIKR